MKSRLRTKWAAVPRKRSTIQFVSLSGSWVTDDRRYFGLWYENVVWITKWHFQFIRYYAVKREQRNLSCKNRQNSKQTLKHRIHFWISLSGNQWSITRQIVEWRDWTRRFYRNARKPKVDIASFFNAVFRLSRHSIDVPFRSILDGAARPCAIYPILE
jgi:hypothetical protein